MSVFMHGVASGDPDTERAIIWTRVTTSEPASQPLTWRVSSNASMSDVVASGEAVAGPEDDFTTQVDVGGLHPGTHYWYEFERRRRDLPHRPHPHPPAGQALTTSASQ